MSDKNTLATAAEGPWRQTRREALAALAGVGASALSVWACGDSESATGGTSATGGNAGASGTTKGGWATTGTQLMDGKDYGDPFADGVGSRCTAYDDSTEGPCHAPSPQRRDVSEGYAGLPMRLELMIVDTQCKAVPSAVVEIWHCDTAGVYSGDVDGNNDDFCTGGDSRAAAASWYRGVQTAGTDGRVTFDTNFPGWYGGRATHIHFRITVGGVERLVSQLFFDQELIYSIYNAHPAYEPTTAAGYQTNVGDNVLSQAGLSLDEVVCSTSRQADGALLAWKAIAIS